MADTPDPQSVGRELVRQYYTMLNERPDCLHRLGIRVTIIIFSFFLHLVAINFTYIACVILINLCVIFMNEFVQLIECNLNQKICIVPYFCLSYSYHLFALSSYYMLCEDLLNKQLVI